MFPEIVLATWTAAGLTWWLTALWLVRGHRHTEATPPITGHSRCQLSIFKPLPPLGRSGIEPLASGLESFIAQLDLDSEMLLGIHASDRASTRSFVARMQGNYPSARLKIIYRTESDDVANPKIAWQRILADYAEGDLWLWSDADITAPSGFLRNAREEFARCGAAMMTFPYIVAGMAGAVALLEALFVNVEFYPGVLLLRKLGPVDFGLGAGLLFRRDAFLRNVDWDELGASLADDFALGQRLAPVRIGSATLSTAVASSNWREALGHDLRWAKTIVWNRPVGSFARVLVMPVIGWLAAAAMYPGGFLVWLGLVGMVQAEVFFAAVICRSAGCRLRWGNLPGLEFWSFWRIALWFLCWLPWPVVWSGKMWRGPRMESVHELDIITMRDAVDKNG